MQQIPANENNYGVGRAGHTVNKVIVHWMVGTLASTDATFQNPTRKASAHYGIENGEIHQYVQEKDTAWHASNLTVNRESIGIEHSGGDLLADGTRRKPSELTHQTSGKLIGEICKRYNIPIDDQHILPHNKYSATQCPGTLDIPLLIKIAKGETMYTEEQMTAVRLERDKNWDSYQSEIKKNEALQKQIDEHVCPITPPEVPITNFVINGMSKTYEKDGVKITENYAVKQ